MPHKKQLSSSMIHGYHHLLVPGSSDPNNNGSSSSLNAATTSPRQRTESSRSQIPTDISIMKNKDKLDIRYVHPFYLPPVNFVFIFIIIIIL